MDASTLNVKPGDRLPEFTLPAQYPDGSRREIHSDDLRGKPVVLFFFPKADTPGWTKEAVGFSELLDEFAKFDAEVFGASRDSLNAMLKFSRKYRLRVPLLSDNGARLRTLLGNPDGDAPASRITYVIDAQGVVRAAIGVPRIAADEHPQAALDTLEALKNSWPGTM